MGRLLGSFQVISTPHHTKSHMFHHKNNINDYVLYYGCCLIAYMFCCKH